MFVAWVTTNLSQRRVGRLVQLPAPVTFILSQLGLPLSFNRLIDTGECGGILSATLMKFNGTSLSVMNGTGNAPLAAVVELAAVKTAALPARSHLSIWVRWEQRERE
jgi:hypothetical protein